MTAAMGPSLPEGCDTHRPSGGAVRIGRSEQVFPVRVIEQPFEVKASTERMFHHLVTPSCYGPKHLFDHENITPPSGGQPIMTESQLTQRQQEILVFIERTVGERGYPPSVR